MQGKHGFKQDHFRTEALKRSVIHRFYLFNFWELEEKMAKEREKEENLKKLKEATERWRKFVNQLEAQSAQLARDVQGISKPLARFAVDEDLERMLKRKEREGDPMRQYIAKKKAKSGEWKPVRPTYKVPPPPSNRFGILPGYRWDGVDRSSGFEKMYFEKKNKAVAIQDEAYKWSVSDIWWFFTSCSQIKILTKNLHFYLIENIFNRETTSF